MQVPSAASDNRPRILLFVSNFLPGYKSGGPARSIANLMSRLGGEFDFWIITKDRDLGSTVAYDNVPIDQWTEAYGGHLYYASPSKWKAKTLINLANSAKYDILYLNSVFAAQATILPLISRKLGLLKRTPLIIASRGEFAKSALALKSLKKRSFLLIARLLRLHAGALWQASSEFEASDIAKVIQSVEKDTVVAPDLAIAPPKQSAYLSRPKAHDAVRVCFLSRISPVKNLDMAIKIISRLRLPVDFNIYGPEEDQVYVTQCRELSNKLPLNVRCKWAGPIIAEEVHNVLSHHDIFLLPTKGENFGHVIAEALGAGTPVVVANTTPWRNLQKAGVGYDLPLGDSHAFVAAIEAIANLKSEEYLAMRRRAATFAASFFDNERDLIANRALFRRALSKKSTREKSVGVG